MTTSLRPIQVLIIDDSETDRRIYRRYFSEANEFEVHEAPTAKAGLQAIEASRPDCILLDYRLPDQTGLEFLAEIRKFTECPVIFITGNPEASLMGSAFRAGAVSYLSKDLLDRQNLLETVKKAAGRMVG